MAVKWEGYNFEVYDPSQTTWNDYPGVYVFAGINPVNQWVPLYVGQADSFRNRIPSHERWTQAAQMGATHVLAITVPQVAIRDGLERGMIATFQPALNTHYRFPYGFA